MNLLKYIVVNTIFAASLIAAIFYHIKWAENIAVFYIGFVTIFTLLISVKIELFINQQAIKGLQVPRWLDLTFDIICLAVMVGAGWIWCGIGYTLHILILSHVYNKAHDMHKAAKEE